MKLTPASFIVVTDYGNVALSEKTLNYLNTRAPEWRDKWNLDKKPRSKQDKDTVRVINKVILSVATCAEIEWAVGGVLEVF